MCYYIRPLAPYHSRIYVVRVPCNLLRLRFLKIYHEINSTPHGLRVSRLGDAPCPSRKRLRPPNLSRIATKRMILRRRKKKKRRGKRTPTRLKTKHT
jgi:hypothetical protein